MASIQPTRTMTTMDVRGREGSGWTLNCAVERSGISGNHLTTNSCAHAASLYRIKRAADCAPDDARARTSALGGECGAAAAPKRRPRTALRQRRAALTV